MKRHRGERGFTLIELLVVILIIGILAGIAIPMYLKQRRKGYRAAATADMKNAALAVETYSTNDGSFLGMNLADENSALLKSEGYNLSPWSDLIVYASATEFCIRGKHKDLPGLELVFTSQRGAVEVGTPGEFPCAPYP